VTAGVSFVVPVHNGAACIGDALASIVAQFDGRPIEIIVVDDLSQDDSAAIARRFAGEWPLRVVQGHGRGAAAAINIGIREAKFPIICQVDQDVVLRPGWLRHVTRHFHDPTVGAVQGYYVTDRGSTLCARVMGFDLEQRYAAIEGDETTHVCTGNAAYRTEALRHVGLLDETFGYGYDNDLSYRLQAAGYRLRLCREAQSVHRWREGIGGYLVQQYGFGYGRIDIVAKHPGHIAGDSVSRLVMMLHPLLMALATAGILAGALAAALGFSSNRIVIAAGLVIGALALERLVAGLRAAWRFADPTPLLFPVLHLGRDLSWMAAIVMWLVRRIGRCAPQPAHSMRARRAPPTAGGGSASYNPEPNRPAM
jgi:cellulose synthase/poly-beta-1,6-N-acetylglucosamine synthase-like glycosyltransferase